MRLLPALLCLVFFAACERQPPLSRAQAQALAQAFLQRHAQDWGPVQDAQQDPQPDARGRQWWRVIYAPDDQGQARVIEVNRRSAWVRFARPESVTEDSVQARVLLLGEVQEWSAKQEAEWQARIEGYRVAALDAGVDPAYSIRRSAHSWQLVWGWHKEGGSLVSAHEQSWLSSQHTGAQWIILDQQE